MRTKLTGQPMARITEVKIEEGRLRLRGEFAFTCPLPQQDERLPEQLEAAIEAGGQEIKRRLFQASLEHAELQLLLAGRQGKDGQGFQRRGYKPYCFKAVFGTVPMRRQQVKQKADGSVVLPSAEAWQTPDRMCITPGLRAAVCDGMLEQSVRQTARRVANAAGEEDLLCATECLKIVHEEGTALQAAQQQRAAAVLAADPSAQRQLLPAPDDGPTADADETPCAAALALADDGDSEPALAALPPLGFPGAAAAEPVDLDQPRQVDAGVVLVQADEVKVHAQPSTGQQEILVYTAVVLAACQRWHVTASSSVALIGQVAGLLAHLGVHRGQRSLLFLADGARWIRNWFDQLDVPAKAMILCWYHLVKKCQQQLSMACKGRKHREEIQAEVLGHLWEGRVEEALAVLQARRCEMRSALALDQLVEYITRRRAYLPNYKSRQQAGLWIASNRVEKFNDWAVSERCKHQGMAWTVAGVNALAALEAARRNGDLQPWRQTQALPAWTECQAA
jgi:hypothetical protein